jgi:hypothetical protein
MFLSEIIMYIAIYLLRLLIAFIMFISSYIFITCNFTSTSGGF